MKLVVYLVPFSCYPRVQHAVRHLKHLSDRFVHLTNDFPLVRCSLQGINASCNITDFFLCIQITEAGTPLDIKDVLKRSEKCGEHGIKDIYEVRDFVSEHEKTYFVLVLDEKIDKDLIPQSDRIRTLLATENEEQENTTSKRCNDTQNQNIYLQSKISDVMEENVYEAFAMKIKCEQLFEVLQSKTIQENMKYFSSSKQKVHTSILLNGRESNVDINPNGQSARDRNILKERHHFHEENVPAKRSKSARERCKTDDLVTELGELDILQGRLTTSDLSSKTKSESSVTHISYTAMKEYDLLNVEEKEVLAEQLDIIGRLYDEMIGMFSRSHVTKEKRPYTDEVSYGTVSDELKEKLKLLSPYIRGCGYRCRTFHVFVDDKFDGSKLKPEIERILKDDNCLSPVAISSLCIKQFSTCEVGSKITAEFEKGKDKSGTLGGFAHSGEENKTVCLLSRHVVTDIDGNPASNLKVSENNVMAEVLVDKSIRGRKGNVLDIAAASVECFDNDLNTNYKTSEEKPATGKLTVYSRDEMKGLPVQICGSSTPTGHGTITMSKMYAVQDKDMESFIIVEDREDPLVEKKPFCAAGDSGAIVCADDQENPDRVHLISMVIGENLTKPGTYQTLDLKDGIQQVEEEIKSKIKLL